MRDPFDEDTDLRDLLSTLSPSARDDLRRVLIHDQADRDAVSSQLLRTATDTATTGPTIIVMLTMYPEARRKLARVLGEIEARDA